MNTDSVKVQHISPWKEPSTYKPVPGFRFLETRRTRKQMQAKCKYIKSNMRPKATGTDVPHGDNKYFVHLLIIFPMYFVQVITFTLMG